MIDQSEILNCNQVQFSTLFFGCAQLRAPFTTHGNVAEFGGEIPISWAKPLNVDCFAINVLSGVMYWTLLEMLLGNKQQEEPHYWI